MDFHTERQEQERQDGKCIFEPLIHKANRLLTSACKYKHPTPSCQVQKRVLEVLSGYYLTFASEILFLNVVEEVIR